MSYDVIFVKHLIKHCLNCAIFTIVLSSELKIDFIICRFFKSGWSCTSYVFVGNVLNSEWL